jgi:large subunit ribosomal protein L15
LGRGQGSGGSTAGRGHKGAQSRSGYSKKIGFEGGQMPLQRRVPKFGFKNNNKVYFKAINLDVLSTLAETAKADTISVQSLIENGLISKVDKVKVLGRGELKGKVNVEAHAFSATAVKAIEAAGGTATTVK